MKTNEELIQEQIRKSIEKLANIGVSYTADFEGLIKAKTDEQLTDNEIELLRKYEEKTIPLLPGFNEIGDDDLVGFSLDEKTLEQQKVISLLNKIGVLDQIFES